MAFFDDAGTKAQCSTTLAAHESSCRTDRLRRALGNRACNSIGALCCRQFSSHFISCGLRPARTTSRVVLPEIWICAFLYAHSRHASEGNARRLHCRDSRRENCGNRSHASERKNAVRCRETTWGYDSASGRIARRGKHRRHDQHGFRKPPFHATSASWP